MKQSAHTLDWSIGYARRSTIAGSEYVLAKLCHQVRRFPPVAFGCAYNLSPEVRDSVQSALLELDWTGTKLAEEMSPGEAKQFLPIVYKDDWANIRRVDQAASNANNSLR